VTTQAPDMFIDDEGLGATGHRTRKSDSGARADRVNVTYGPLTATLARDAARLHSTYLTDFFLAGMGLDLLVRYYAHHYGRRDAISFVARDGSGRVVGVVSGAGNYTAFLQSYYRANFIRLGFGVTRSFWSASTRDHTVELGLRPARAGIRALLNKRGPRAVSRFPEKDLSCQTAELAAIVVHPDLHGKGVARELYRLFEEQAIRIGVRRVRSTVLASNARTIAFNKKVGLRRVEVLPKDLVFEKLLPSQPQTAGKANGAGAREGTIPEARLAPDTFSAGSGSRRCDAMNARPPYVLALTHDVDVLSVRDLPWTSRTLWGFAARCLVGNVVRLWRGRISFSQYLRGLLPGALLPLVKSRILADPTEESFKKMLEIERRHDVRSTLYFIPEANLPGTAPSGRAAPSHRAAYYSIQRMRHCLCLLESEGWEVGVHGVNAYCDLGAARRELQAVSSVLRHNGLGHRSHWLYSKGRSSWELLRDAGYTYDASYGSNFHVGWPGGRRWPFRPFPDHPFTVLGLNIQDETLLHATRQNLGQQEAWRRISALMGDARQRGGVLTVLWHAHSFSAPSYWADTYERIIAQAKTDGAAIVPAKEAIALWRERGEPDG